MSVSLTLTLRPIRLAVIADCRSPDGLLNALQATTMQWGGSANPLVPYLEAYPPSLSEGFERINSIEKAYDVVARRHDPDRVLRVVSEPLSFQIESVELGNILKVDPDIVWDSCVGVSLLEMARLFHYEQLRFVQREPVRTVYVEGGEDLKLSTAILYGVLPANVRNAFLEALGGIVAPTIVNANNFYEPFFQGDVTPRSIGQYHLSLSERLVVGCIHEADPLDTVAIWNAAVDYRNLIPLPLGTESSDQLLHRLIQHCQSEELNQILVIRSPSVNKDELEKVFCAFREANIAIEFLGLRTSRTNEIREKGLRTWQRTPGTPYTGGTRRRHRHRLFRSAAYRA